MDGASPGGPQEPGGTSGLVAAILGRGEVALFENLYSAYEAEARRMARGLLGDTAAALDAVQAAYLEILRQLLHGQRWNDPAEARAAVLRNTRWASLNALRSERRRRAALSEAASRPQPAPDEWARSEARMLCEQIVQRLPIKDRQVIQLRFTDGRSNAEAGEHLGITEKAFELRLARALKRARRLAQSSELLPTLAPVTTTRPTPRPAGRHVALWRDARRSILHAVAAAALVGLAATLIGRHLDDTTTRTVGAAASTGSVATALHQQSPPETTEDTLFSGAIAIPVAHGVEVLAWGQGLRCGCPLLWRSLDAGDTWKSLSGPPSMWDRARGSAARAVACGRASQVPFCFGHAPSDATGLVLALGAGHLLYFSPFGGIRVSPDRGHTWAEPA